MARLIPGETYFIRYLDYHNDPAPLLYVMQSDRNDTYGFNLHYLPQIRFRIPLDRYKRVSESKWARAFNNMKEAGQFKGFLEILEEARENEYSRLRYRAVLKLIQRKHPWAMEAYRHYKTPKIRVKKKV